MYIIYLCILGAQFNKQNKRIEEKKTRLHKSSFSSCPQNDSSCTPQK